MKTYTQDDVLQAIRREINASSLRATARRIGKSAAYVSHIMKGYRGVSEAVAAQFGFVREVIFRKIA